MTVVPADTLSYPDTTQVCMRNSLSGVSFYDNGSFIRHLSVPRSDKVIINLSEQAKGTRAEQKLFLEKNLKSGEMVPDGQLNSDFVVIILLASVILLTLVRSSLKSFQPVTRFFLFRGISEKASGDTNVLFHWQSTLLNLMAFFIISLFAYQAVTIQGGMPGGITDVLFWSVCLLIIIAALTARHIICSVTGNLSGQQEVFNEYLVSIYHSYHFTALILFILIIVTTYTALLPPKAYVVAGLCGFGLMYMIRAVRLFLIFMSRNISIFYLILYLCALEILPVAIVMRYITAPVKIG